MWLSNLSVATTMWSIFAADDPLPGIPPIAQWTSALGALGLIVLGFLRGWIIPGLTHDREVSALTRRVETLDAQNQAKDEELRQQTVFMRDQLVPLAVRTQDVLAKLLEERAWDERAQRLREQRNQPPT